MPPAAIHASLGWESSQTVGTHSVWECNRTAGTRASGRLSILDCTASTWQCGWCGEVSRAGWDTGGSEGQCVPPNALLSQRLRCFSL